MRSVKLPLNLSRLALPTIALGFLVGCASKPPPVPAQRTSLPVQVRPIAAPPQPAAINSRALPNRDASSQPVSQLKTNPAVTTSGQGSAPPPPEPAQAKPLTESKPRFFNWLGIGSATAQDEPILQTQRFDDLIDRIRSGFQMPELDTPLVAQHERWILRNPEYLNRVFDRGGKYLHHIVEELEARKMPAELALLPIVESAFNPQALSTAKAAGLWQFIPSTGRIYDLEQNWWLDQRRDVIESTRAALDYLEKLYKFQGDDWFLALASYNWGEGSVMRARKRNEARGKPTGYLDLKMPKETQNYVPKLIALRNILARPADFGVTLPKIPNEPYFVIIDKEQSIDLALAAKFAGMSVKEFVELNPSHHRPVISASRNNRIILPADRAQRFQQELLAHSEKGLPLVSWKPYTLKGGESLATLAKRAGVSSSELIRANGLKPNAKPLAGTTLLAPIAVQEDEMHIEKTLAKFSGTRVVEREQIRAIYHRVRKSDTLAKIARRYKVSQAELRRLNKLTAEIQPGQRLLIRPASTRTVMTDEQGKKSVVKAPPKPAAQEKSNSSKSSQSSTAKSSSPKTTTAPKAPPKSNNQPKA